MKKEKIMKIVKNKIIIFSTIALVAIAIFACFVVTPIVRNNQKAKLASEPLFQYDVMNLGQDDDGEDDPNKEYKLLIKITSVDGLESITYKKQGTDEDVIIYCNNRMQVALDFIAKIKQDYEFKIKQTGKEEVIETLHYEAPFIPGEYTLVNGVYSNVPDLTGYNQNDTRYLTINGAYLTPGDWIDKEKPENWYDYHNQKWANIYVENKGLDAYYTWIPRYCFKVDNENSVAGNERTDVKFINMDNSYLDADGNETTWLELKAQGYRIPAAFKFNGTKIPGYWAMKYTAGDTITPSIINYSMSVNRGKIEVARITLNTTITSANPITKYTFALNGEVKETIEDAEKVSAIYNQTVQFTGMKEGENIVNVTALNARGEIVGSMTKMYVPAKVNPPELDGFNKDTTFYVTYDESGVETSVIPISKDAPEDWYEYGERRWANIVTRNNGLETYYTWIPRYKFMADNTNQTTDVIFLEGTEGLKQGDLYAIPEAFTFAGKPLTGYWAMKYTAGDNFAPRFDTELTATSNSIKTKGIIGSAVANAGQTYIYYMDGVEKYRTTNRWENYEYTELESGKLYTILVEIRNTANNAYIGTIVKQIKTIAPNPPELQGFNPDITYYVKYDADGNETIGDKITNDGSNIPGDWYDYSNKKWANIVVTNGTIVDGKITGATMTTYYTWIPRYQYKITPEQAAQPAVGRAQVRFLEGISNEIDEAGWAIPEAFTFNGKPLTGYWAMKYTAGG